MEKHSSETALKNNCSRSSNSQAISWTVKVTTKGNSCTVQQGHNEKTTLLAHVHIILHHKSTKAEIKKGNTDQ